MALVPLGESQSLVVQIPHLSIEDDCLVVSESVVTLISSVWQGLVVEDLYLIPMKGSKMKEE